MSLERFAEKSAANLYERIQRARVRPLARILNGLGIRHVGFQTAIDLADWIAAEWPPDNGESDADWTATRGGHAGRDASGAVSRPCRASGRPWPPASAGSSLTR